MKLTFVPHVGQKATASGDRKAQLLELIISVAVSLGPASLRPSVALQSDVETLARRVGTLRRWVSFWATSLPAESSLLQPSRQDLYSVL